MTAFIIMTSLQQIGCSGSPDVDGIKIFDEDDHAAKHFLNVLWPGILYQKF